MKVHLTLRPGAPGTKSLQRVYGDTLICVRYRYDPQSKRRHKTVELIVDSIPWEPKPPTPRHRISPEAIVSVWIHPTESDLPARIEKAGGKWVPEHRTAYLRYDTALRLRLESRIGTPRPTT